MKLKMAKNSIFAILLRSAWWISAVIAVAIVAAARALLPPEYFGVGAFAAFPFVIIAGISLYRQWRAPSPARVEETLAAVRAMAWPDFARVLEQGFARDGCEVGRTEGRADFLLRRQGRLAIVAARRWKASRVGVEALRELSAAAEVHGAHERLYVAVGEVSGQAAQYARQNQIQLVGAQELARLLPRDILLNQARPQRP